MLGNEWYVAAYYVGEQTETQPFGSSTILGEWCGGGKIDDYETPYRRVLVDVEFIKE